MTSPTTMNNQLQLSLLDRQWVNINAPLVLTAMLGRQFSSDDLHTILPTPDNSNLYGVLLARLSSQGAIIRVGSVKSSRKSANGRHVGLYHVAETTQSQVMLAVGMAAMAG